MAEVLVATDLDQTLLFSPAATARLGGGRPARPVEVLDGVVVSELADVVSADLRALPADLLVVPATTRTPAQLARVGWPIAMPWAVAASGGVILRDGVPDREWTAEVARATGDAEATARAVLDRHVGAVARVRGAEVFVYAVGDPAALGERAAELAAEVHELGWRVEHQERKLYVLPASLDKSHAVRRVADLTGATTTWAAGDSLLDAAMIAAVDRAWVPRGSPLAATPLGRHVTVTAAPGHAAAAEIVAAWSGQPR